MVSASSVIGQSIQLTNLRAKRSIEIQFPILQLHTKLQISTIFEMECILNQQSSRVSVLPQNAQLHNTIVVHFIGIDCKCRVKPHTSATPPRCA
ncbi:hypothetical protein Y032_0103g3528 [Ancylostoma ceylanicum]|uniref:Uncharacterized protein n=1 Tax=Ancylostoma ceylanicum TaxID=53326 RepID=A0A016TGS4_9BILA|nr:hypothetical protein Y032_0103g3528 [Ancylostoma ceylanicum]